MTRVALLAPATLALAACSRSSAPAPAPACPSLTDRTAEAQTLYGPTVHLAPVDGTSLYVDPDHSPLFDESLRFASRVRSHRPAAALLRQRLRLRIRQVESSGW